MLQSEKGHIIEMQRQIGRDLIKTYGIKRFYRPKEIMVSCQKFKFLERSCWAMCLFADRGSFDNYHASNGKTCDYLKMRDEVISFITNGASESWANFDFNSSWLDLPGLDYGSFFDLPEFNILVGS